MIVICEWNASSYHLGGRLVTDGARIALQAAEGPSSLIERIAAKARPPCLVLFQVNLSYPERVPCARESVAEQLRARGYAVWNARICDITKRNVQRWNRALGLPGCEAERDGDPGERLIIKNNFNAHARAEKNLTDRERELLGYPPYQQSPIHDQPEYPVLLRHEVPQSFWDSPDLAIERFIGNVGGLFARIYFAGTTVIVSSGRSETPVRRMADCRQRFDILTERHVVDDPQQCARLPEPLLGALRGAVKMADAMSLDFGCIDVVMDDDDRSYVVDINCTPFWGRHEHPEFFAHLRSGFEHVLPSMGAEEHASA